MYGVPKRAWLISALLLITLLASCTTASDIEGKNIGLIVSTTDNPFFRALVDGAQTEASMQEVTLHILDSENNVETEYAAVESLISEGIDSLLINPTDSDAVYPAIRLANESKIPVITVDRASSGGRVVCHIASDNEAGGRLAATYMIELLGNAGKYAEMRGIEGTSAAMARGLGFNEEMIEKGDMTFAAQVTADFDRDKGYEMMKKLLAVHPDLDALFAHNDEMAVGASLAAEELNSDVRIIGFDGTLDGLRAVQEGKMAATIVQRPENMGIIAVKKAITYLEGEEVNPVVMVDVELVTQ